MMPVLVWLIICAALVFSMIVVGGLTRLTQSGLSMVDWRPVTGWLPPMDMVAWQSAFDEYKRFPEYLKLNQGMELGEFKSIYWFEFIHRILGRVIGLVFLLPFLFFAINGKLSWALGIRLAAIFVLGAVQGMVGWWMVKSGLINYPDVSHYRLAVHLGIAVVIYSALVWTALSVYFRGQIGLKWTLSQNHVGAMVCVFAIFCTVLSGALVAGLDAGFAYNTFPTMNGAWIPEGIMAQNPWYLNFTENTIAVQFEHRWLACLTVAGALVLWWSQRTRRDTKFMTFSVNFLATASIIQVVLGILTVVLVVPIPIAAAHQAGAMILLTSGIFVAYALRGRGVHGI